MVIKFATVVEGNYNLQTGVFVQFWKLGKNEIIMLIGDFEYVIRWGQWP